MSLSEEEGAIKAAAEQLGGGVVGKEEEEEEEEEAVIYIQIVGRDIYHWYAIGKNASGGSTTTEEEEGGGGMSLSLLPQLEFRWQSSCAAVGPNIYVIGGKKADNLHPSGPNSNTVFCFDTSSGGRWVEIEPMTEPRESPYVVPLPDGRIFVMGGIYEYGRDTDVPPAEIYDPEDRKWTPCNSKLLLHDPNKKKIWGIPHIMDGHVIMGDSGKILMHVCNTPSLFCYDVAEDAWEEVAGFGEYGVSSALVDGVFYVLDYYTADELTQQLFGYDFGGVDTTVPFNEQPQLVRKLPVRIIATTTTTDDDDSCCLPLSYTSSTLLALGNSKLAVVWAIPLRKKEWLITHPVPWPESRLVVFVSYFAMAKEERDGTTGLLLQGLVARHLSTKKFVARGSVLENCLAVFSKPAQAAAAAAADDDDNVLLERKFKSQEDKSNGPDYFQISRG